MGTLGPSVGQLAQVPLPPRLGRRGDLCCGRQAVISGKYVHRSSWRSPTLNSKICLLFNHPLTKDAGVIVFQKAVVMQKHENIPGAMSLVIEMFSLSPDITLFFNNYFLYI